MNPEKRENLNGVSSGHTDCDFRDRFIAGGLSPLRGFIYELLNLSHPRRRLLPVVITSVVCLTQDGGVADGAQQEERARTGKGPGSRRRVGKTCYK